MTKLPSDPELKIGKPQVIARVINLDGMQVLVRLQKPFEEAPEEDKPSSQVRYGPALIVEAWSDATKSIITEGVRKPKEQTEETFQFGVRYMMNHSSDAEIAHVLMLKGIHTTVALPVRKERYRGLFTEAATVGEEKANLKPYTEISLNVI
jgi:hypothetical protein